MAEVGAKRGTRGGSKPGERRGGRKKGTPNRITRDVREMVLQALSQAGGIVYLTERAKDTPVAFLSLVGKVLPLQVSNPDGSALAVPGSVVFVIQQAPDSDCRD